MKRFFKSKTLWLNVAAVGVEGVKLVFGVPALPHVDPLVLAALNFGLRFVTKVPIGF